MTQLLAVIALTGLAHTAKLEAATPAMQCQPSGPVCAISSHSAHDFANMCEALRAGAKQVLPGACDDE